MRLNSHALLSTVITITLSFSNAFLAAQAQTSQPGAQSTSSAPAGKPSQQSVKTSYENVTPSSEDILKRIATYTPPPYPDGYLKETYDYRLESKEPVPPTLTDTYICDMWQRINMDLKITGITPAQVSQENILDAFNVYMTRNWENIAGYRPWAHWNFIRSLNDSERLKLAQQTVDYMKMNGVKDVD